MYRARELFARGVLPDRYAKPTESFVETAAPSEFRDITNKLPTGYIFSDWLRCAYINPLCVWPSVNLPRVYHLVRRSYIVRIIGAYKSTINAGCICVDWIELNYRCTIRVSSL